MSCETGSIELSTLPGRSPIIPSKKSIKEVKNRLNRKRKATSRKLAVQLNISRTSVRRILKNDLLLRPYNKIVESLLTDEHKEKRKIFELGTKTFSERGHNEGSVLGRETVRHKWDLQLPK